MQKYKPFIFSRDSDYKRAFEREVNQLLTYKLPVIWRNKLVQDLTDAYIEQIGEVPDSQQLDRLANYILQDDLSDKHADKVSRTDYPILSKGQQKVRYKREWAVGDLNNTVTSNNKYRLNGRKKSQRRLGNDS